MFEKLKGKAAENECTSIHPVDIVGRSQAALLGNIATIMRLR